MRFPVIRPTRELILFTSDITRRLIDNFSCRGFVLLMNQIVAPAALLALWPHLDCSSVAAADGCVVCCTLVYQNTDYGGRCSTRFLMRGVVSRSTISLARLRVATWRQQNGGILRQQTDHPFWQTSICSNGALLITTVWFVIRNRMPSGDVPSPSAEHCAACVNK